MSDDLTLTDGPIERRARWITSAPTYAEGVCPKSGALVVIGESTPFDDDSRYACRGCTGKHGRLELIFQALATLNRFSWGLFASDVFVRDDIDLVPGGSASYDLSSVPMAKWLHEDAWTSSGRHAYSSSVGTRGFLVLGTPETTGLPPGVPVKTTYVRFGLTSGGKVPAWRQSLYGSTTLIDSYPPAAIVLIAAAFESFFLETMRLKWEEDGRLPQSFKQLSDNSQISGLVKWLPEAVSAPSFLQSASYEPWLNQVNRRRNDVVHRAKIDFSPEEARETLRVTLDCIGALDKWALTRPHVYYLP